VAKSCIEELTFYRQHIFIEQDQQKQNEHEHTDKKIKTDAQ
jgi:hypothetical protein